MAVLIFCEDDPTIQKLIRVALRASSHVVHIAPDGNEGLRLIERERPHVVFTDVSMPGLDGLQLCDILKSRPDLAHIPIILLTASIQRVQVEEAYRHGVVDCFTKPFSPADLRAKVAKLTQHVQ